MHLRKSMLAAVFLAVTPLAIAHHGWSQYDNEKLIKLTGTITETAYENPHGTIRLKAEDKTWLVVLAPPYRMENRGLAKEQLKVGETATVEGYAHRNVADELRAERITLAGKTTELR